MTITNPKDLKPRAVAATEADDSHASQLPGPALIGTQYTLVCLDKPSIAINGSTSVAVGGSLSNQQGQQGKVESIVRISDSVVRCTIMAGGTGEVAYVDLMGANVVSGSVKRTGEAWHKPTYVRPEIHAARKALLEMSAEERAKVTDGLTGVAS
jgi:hypothetical protein